MSKNYTLFTQFVDNILETEKGNDMRHLILISVLLTALQAQTLQELIQKALTSATSLAVIEKRIEKKKKNEKSADIFANPTLSIAKNTLPSDQAMSQATVTFGQKIYWWDKRKEKKNVARGDVEIERSKLQRAKVALVAAIKQQAYRVWEMQQLLKIVDEYMELTKASEELYESYSASEDMGKNHMGIMSAKLSLSELKIKKTRYEALLEAAKKRLSYLVNDEVRSVDVQLAVTELPHYDAKEFGVKNADLEIVRNELRKKDAAIELADTNNYPDVNLLATYAYRENFDDYMNFGISMSLPIYSKEDIELQKAKIAKLEAKRKEADVANLVLRSFEEQYALLKAQYRIYKIIKEETMPQIAHMLEISEAMIQNGTSLFEYIDILERKLKLDEQAVDAVTKFYTAKSKIEELRGDLK